jgi:signal transduction histidine kinase
VTGIRARLTFSHLAVIVVAMGLSGLLLLSLLEGYFMAAMEDSLAAQARITAQALMPGAVAGGSAADAPASAFNTVQQRLESNLSLQAQNVAPLPSEAPRDTFDLAYLADASLQLSSQLDTRIRVLDDRGIVLVDSAGGSQGADLTADPLVVAALAGQTASHAERGGSEPAMSVALPVLVDGRLVGAVYLSQPLRDAVAVVRDLRRLWLASTGVALALSAAVGLLLSGAISRPLRRLTAAAGAVAGGDLEQQVPAGSRDELGRLSRAFNDMTARLRAARQMQTDFVANVSHELRTPLTAVKGTVETLRDGAVDDPEVRDRFLETIETETDRLIRLVNGLLLLSRADSEALDLRLQEVDLAHLVRKVLDRLAGRAGARQLSLEMEVGPGLPPVLADADRLEQVVVNLLDNACKYAPEGSVVSVRVGAGMEFPAALSLPPGTGQVYVRVQDQGPGIPAADLPRIGERFYRADPSRSRGEGGSGLGVAIARALVEAHGGYLWLESQEERGTAATFTLPAAPRPGA